MNWAFFETPSKLIPLVFYRRKNRWLFWLRVNLNMFFFKIVHTPPYHVTSSVVLLETWLSPRCRRKGRTIGPRMSSLYFKAFKLSSMFLKCVWPLWHIPPYIITFLPPKRSVSMIQVFENVHLAYEVHHLNGEHSSVNRICCDVCNLQRRLAWFHSSLATFWHCLKSGHFRISLQCSPWALNIDELSDQKICICDDQLLLWTYSRVWYTIAKDESSSFDVITSHGVCRYVDFYLFSQFALDELLFLLHEMISTSACTILALTIPTACSCLFGDNRGIKCRICFRFCKMSHE